MGAIGGPLGLVLWSGTGALIGGAAGASKESTFMPLLEEFEARLAPDASMQILVGATPALDALVAAIRRPLTSEQAAELSKAAA